jgi:hypothetical protein
MSYSLGIFNRVFVVKWIVPELEGSGFTQTVNRSILGAIFLIAGKRGKVFVGSSCEEVIATAPDRIRTELSAALLTARGRGMFSPVAA